MKKVSVSMIVKKLVSNINKGDILFNHPIQRKSDQWSDEQKSLLIHSLLCDYPVPPLYAVQDPDESNRYSILDGKQRLTILSSYMKNEWKLIKTLPEVIIDKEIYDVGGMKFSELPEEAREEFESASLLMYIFDDCSEDEIEEIFYRLNNGTALTKDQKTRTKLGDRLARFIDEVLELDFFKNKAYFTPNQLKRGEDQTCILQTLILLTGYKYKTFNNDDVVDFAEHYRVNHKEDDLKKCIDLFTVLNNLFHEKHRQIKKINIPIFAMTLKTAIELDVPLEKFGNWVNSFIREYSPECEYAKYCGQGSTNKDKISHRIELAHNSLLKFTEERKGA